MVEYCRRYGDGLPGAKGHVAVPRKRASAGRADGRLPRIPACGVLAGHGFAASFGRYPGSSNRMGVNTIGKLHFPVAACADETG